jgi:hypothetical protein
MALSVRDLKQRRDSTSIASGYEYKLIDGQLRNIAGVRAVALGQRTS